MSNLQTLLTKLKSDYPRLNFKPSDSFSWNHAKQTIYYQELKDKINEVNLEALYSFKLLHELAHAKLKHQEYHSDLELIKLESSAWNLAKDLCKEYGVKFLKKEKDAALSSYINWASSRSACPSCTKSGLQISKAEFTCPNCSHTWKVGTSRFTRTYRQS